MGCLVSLSRLSLPLGAGSTEKPKFLTVLRSQIPPQAATWKPKNVNNRNPWIIGISENMWLCNKGLGSWLMRSYLIYKNSSLLRQADLPCVKQAFLDRLLPTARAVSSTSSPPSLHQCAVLGWTSLRWQWDGWLSQGMRIRMGNITHYEWCCWCLRDVPGRVLYCRKVSCSVIISCELRESLLPFWAWMDNYGPTLEE